MKKSGKKKKEDKEKKEEEFGGVAGSVLRGLGDIVPGLGGLIKGLEKSDAFRERLEAINQEIERKLREGPLKGVERGAPHIRTKFATRTLARDRTPFRKRAEEPVPKPEEPPVDLFDEEDHLMVIAELPGIEEKDIKVDLEDDKLTISAHRANRKYHREIELPSTPKSSEFEKVYRNGILEIRIQKTEKKD